MTVFLAAIAGPLALFGATVNLALAGYYLLLIRRQYQLNFLLQKLCIDAFLRQHLPIWGPWGDAFDMNLKIDIRSKETL
jgi:hypothetical protein